MRIMLKNISYLVSNSEVMLNDVNLVINNNEIEYIGTEEKDCEKIIDCTNKLVMPGLVNAHTHLGLSMFKNYADDLSFSEWLFDKILPLEEKLNGEDVYYASLLSMIEMIKSGTTCFSDMYFHVDDLMKALEVSGMRGMISRGIVDGGDRIKENIELHEKYNGISDGKINVNLGPHAIYTCSEETLKKVLDASKKYEMSIHIHMAETKHEYDECVEKTGKTPIEYIYDIGLLNKNTYMAHCVWLSSNDVELIKKTDAKIVHNPSSNMKLGSGMANISELCKNNVVVALGTDSSASNNNLNLFIEMRLASYIAKATTGRSEELKAKDVIKMATENGAEVLNIKNLGVLEEKKLADMIILDIENAEYYPRYNMMHNIVYSVSSRDVETVIIDGKIIMEEKKLTTIDEKDVYENIERLKKKLIGGF